MTVQERNNPSARASNFELLRIISMLLIIAGHLGGQAFGSDLGNAGRIWITIFGNGSRIAVNLFLMIGCWFMLDRPFKAERVVKLYSTTWFYSVVFTVLAILVGAQPSTFQVISAFFPFIRKSLWYITSYISVLLIAPFLKKLMDVLDKQSQLKLIVVLTFLVPFMSTISKMMDTYLCSITWFIYILLLVTYYKSNQSFDKIKKEFFMIAGLSIYILLVMGRLICQLSGQNQLFVLGDTVLGQYLGDYKSIPNFLCSCLIFIYFTKFELRNKTINNVAQNTLDVYIIHQVPVFYPVMWNMFRPYTWQQSNYFGFYYTVIVASVFIICTVIGRVREQYLEPIWCRSKSFNRICNRLNTFYKSL